MLVQQTMIKGFNDAEQKQGQQVKHDSWISHSHLYREELHPRQVKK